MCQKGAAPEFSIGFPELHTQAFVLVCDPRVSDEDAPVRDASPDLGTYPAVLLPGEKLAAWLEFVGL